MTGRDDFRANEPKRYFPDVERPEGAFLQTFDLEENEFAQVFLAMANDITRTLTLEDFPTEMIEAHFSMVARVVASLRGKDQIETYEEDLVDRRASVTPLDPPEPQEPTRMDDGDSEAPRIMSGY